MPLTPSFSLGARLRLNSQHSTSVRTSYPRLPLQLEASIEGSVSKVHPGPVNKANNCIVAVAAFAQTLVAGTGKLLIPGGEKIVGLLVLVD